MSDDRHKKTAAGAASTSFQQNQSVIDRVRRFRRHQIDALPQFIFILSNFQGKKNPAEAGLFGLFRTCRNKELVPEEDLNLARKILFFNVYSSSYFGDAINGANKSWKHRQCCQNAQKGIVENHRPDLPNLLPTANRHHRPRR